MLNILSMFHFLSQVPGMDPAREGEMFGSNAYILVSSALIFAMSIPGLPLLYGGLVQSKHAVSTMTQCLAVAPVISILWILLGYSLSFSGNGLMLGDLNQVMLIPEQEDRSRTYQTASGPLPESSFILFQGTFATITPMLIVGAWAERAKFLPAVLFCGLWSIFAYCPLAHWIWGNGWLAQLGIRDFAGGLVVHTAAGAAGLTAALMLPSRPGFPKDVAGPHSMPMVITGLGIIWTGWFGFNGGSALQAGGAASLAALNTQISACVALGVWMGLECLTSKPTLESAINGTIAGLGAITPASGFTGVSGSLCVGIVGAVTTYGAWFGCKRLGWADDALDVFPIHGVSGIFGTLMTAPCSTHRLGGIGFEPGMTMGSLFRTQFLGVLATCFWSGAVSFVLIKALDASLGFCHSTDVQLRGLDLEDHDGEAYVFDTSAPLKSKTQQSLYGSTSDNQES